jgi:ABC-type Zn uptake system ZnuABC Zn-binding protein ZnuA
MMPYSDTFSLNKIQVEFVLSDNTKKVLETKVAEREIAKIQYVDAISKGKTAVLSYTQNSSANVKSMLRIMLGNFPANSKAYLIAYCTQELDFED